MAIAALILSILALIAAAVAGVIAASESRRRLRREELRNEGFEDALMGLETEPVELLGAERRAYEAGRARGEVAAARLQGKKYTGRPMPLGNFARGTW